MARWGQADRRVTARTVRLHMDAMKRLAGDESVPIAPETTRAKPVQHERREQEALAAWVKRQWWACYWSHVGHERRDRNEAHGMHKAGVKPGIPDNLLALPAGRYCGAWSELKRPGAPESATSIAQRWWLEALEACGYRVGVHRGADEARAFFAHHVAEMTADQERRAREHALRLKEARGDVLPEVGR